MGTATKAGFCRVDSMGPPLAFVGVCDAELGGVLGGEALPARELEGRAGDDAADGLACEQAIEDVEADVPACRAPGNEAAVDDRPQRETGAAAERLELPAQVVAAPAVLEER